jgi:hypothetical protein
MKAQRAAGHDSVAAGHRLETKRVQTSIYQILYDDWLIDHCDPDFMIYDCRLNPEREKREIAHMLRFYDDVVCQTDRDDVFGLLSPKFARKARLPGHAFIDWIRANPGHDVYFVNPYPSVAYSTFNVWTQGEFWHPGLGDLANALFSAAGFPIRVEALPRNSPATLLYCNYWVGRRGFWHGFMRFVRSMVLAMGNLDDATRRRMSDPTPYHLPATYFPFVFERLFSTYLVLQGNVDALAYRYGREAILDFADINEMERYVLREWADLIDGWDADGRSDQPYRKLFANLHAMARLYGSGGQPTP